MKIGTFNVNVQQFNTPIKVKKRDTTNNNGARTPSYSYVTNPDEFCMWKSFGGTEVTQNGVLTILDTAEIIMWYRPDVVKGCAIEMGGHPYEVLGTPEDIENRHIMLKFKVQRAVNG